MRRIHRVVMLALLIGIGPVIAGCTDFDPDKLDVLGINEKKKLPGERKPLFPDGVPGVTQGIPPEYLKGNVAEQTGAAVPIEPLKPEQSQPATQTASTEPAATAEKPKPKPRKRVAAKPKPTRIDVSAKPAPAAPAASPWPSAPPPPAQQAPQQPAQQQAASPWPDPQPQTAPAPWPSAPPPGTFSKQ